MGLWTAPARMAIRAAQGDCVQTGLYPNPVLGYVADEMGTLVHTIERMGKSISDKQIELNRQRDEYQQPIGQRTSDAHPYRVIARGAGYRQRAQDNCQKQRDNQRKMAKFWDHVMPFKSNGYFAAGAAMSGTAGSADLADAFAARAFSMASAASGGM